MFFLNVLKTLAERLRRAAVAGVRGFGKTDNLPLT
jgi:hypothetical protein